MLTLSSPRSAMPLIAVALVCLMATSCAKREIVTGSIEPHADHRQRHPIVIGKQTHSIGIYPRRGPAGLDARQREDVAEFVEEYRRSGTGRISLSMPSSGGRDTQQSLSHLRQELQKNGIPASHLGMGHHSSDNPDAIAPIKLSFSMLAAKVESDCSMWKEDLLQGSSAAGGVQNRPYANFGCATQNNLAAQIADPLDLARPRREDVGDIEKRRKDIKQVRDDLDPSTKWEVETDSTLQSN